MTSVLNWLRMAVALWLCGLVLDAAETGLVTSPFAERFFREQVHPIFVQHCYECHGNGKRKGGLSMATLHEFLEGGNEGVVLVPGDTFKSSLIPAIRWEAHDEELNMPPKGKMSDAEIATVVRWVEMGAPWPVGPAAPASEGAKERGSEGGMPAAPASEGARERGSEGTAPSVAPPPQPKMPPLLGRLHPVVVHFPIACLLLAVLTEFLVFLKPSLPRSLAPSLPDFPATALLVLIGTLGAALAVLSGTFLAQEETAAIERHELLGWITLVGALGCSGLLWLRQRLPLRVALVITAVLVALTAHLGGELVYGAGWFGF